MVTTPKCISPLLTLPSDPRPRHRASTHISAWTWGRHPDPPCCTPAPLQGLVRKPQSSLVPSWPWSDPSETPAGSASNPRGARPCHRPPTRPPTSGSCLPPPAISLHTMGPPEGPSCHRNSRGSHSSAQTLRGLPSHAGDSSKSAPGATDLWPITPHHSSEVGPEKQRHREVR